MKLAVVGSRTWTNQGLLQGRLADAYCSANPKETFEIVSGGARGADTIAQDWAERKDVPCTVFPVDWETHGKSAGFIRNRQIVEACDRVLAFVVPVPCFACQNLCGDDYESKHHRPYDPSQVNSCTACSRRGWTISTGTAHTVRLAKEAGKPVTIYTPDGKEWLF